RNDATDVALNRRGRYRVILSTIRSLRWKRRANRRGNDAVPPSPPARPAQLGRSRARVRAPFLGRGTDHFVGDGGKDAGAQSLLERLLHAPVLARVEGEQRGAAAGAQAFRELAQQRIESSEFVVDLDAHGLERAPHAEIGFVRIDADRESRANRLLELA